LSAPVCSSFTPALLPGGQKPLPADVDLYTELAEHGIPTGLEDAVHS
jgi:hypothetical protein